MRYDHCSGRQASKGLKSLYAIMFLYNALMISCTQGGNWLPHKKHSQNSKLRAIRNCVMHITFRVCKGEVPSQNTFSFYEFVRPSYNGRVNRPQHVALNTGTRRKTTFRSTTDRISDGGPIRL